MNTNYFSKVRILDGGMGQHLLAKGLKPKGSLWSGTALIDKKYHQMVIDSHLDFIKSGADVIVTNNFAGRRVRMAQNNVEKLFDYANEKAGELALKAKEISKKKIYIAGSLPAQNNTYVLDQRNNSDIEKNFYDQAKLLKPFIDFYYLDVLCGSKECEIALNVTEKMNLPVLVGLHVKKNGKHPSNESISEVVKKCKYKNWLGVILACVSPEIIDNRTAHHVKGTIESSTLAELVPLLTESEGSLKTDIWVEVETGRLILLSMKGSANGGPEVRGPSGEDIVIDVEVSLEAYDCLLYTSPSPRD